MGVKPAGHGFAKDALQSDLGTEGHLQGLALRDPSEPSLGQKRKVARERRSEGQIYASLSDRHSSLGGAYSGWRRWPAMIVGGAVLAHCITQLQLQLLPNWLHPRCWAWPCPSAQALSKAVRAASNRESNYVCLKDETWLRN